MLTHGQISSGSFFASRGELVSPKGRIVSMDPVCFPQVHAHQRKSISGNVSSRFGPTQDMDGFLWAFFMPTNPFLRTPPKPPAQDFKKNATSPSIRSRGIAFKILPPAGHLVVEKITPGTPAEALRLPKAWR